MFPLYKPDQSGNKQHCGQKAGPAPQEKGSPEMSESPPDGEHQRTKTKHGGQGGQY